MEQQPFILQCTDETAAAIREQTQTAVIPGAGFFGGLNIQVVKEGVLPAGCIGVMTNPGEPEKLLLLMMTTSQPAQ